MKTNDLYNSHADKWARTEPVSLSDFTGRPAVLQMCEPIIAADILDLGCGEGYFSRLLLTKDPRSIIGIDISEEMIKSANLQNQDDRVFFSSTRGSDLNFESLQFDLVVAVFVYNYLFLEETVKSFKEVFRVLKPGGRFVFSVPHPFFPFIARDTSQTFHFDFAEMSYFTSRDHRADGIIRRRDAVELPVQMCHKTLEDYFSALSQAGFKHMPEVRELKVLPEHIDLDPEFFEPVSDIPLHLAFRVEK